MAVSLEAMRILQAVGAGQYRGIMLQGNEYARAQFTTWMAPFRDLGMTVVSNHSLGSTDYTNAVIMTSFAYHAANAAARIPRKTVR